MATVPDASKPAGPAEADRLVFWDPCSGAQPIVVEDPRVFAMGQLIVLAIGLALLGLLALVALLICAANGELMP